MQLQLKQSESKPLFIQVTLWFLQMFIFQKYKLKHDYTVDNILYQNYSRRTSDMKFFF